MQKQLLTIKWNEEKNQKLIKERDINFKMVAEKIRNGDFIKVTPNNNYNNQRKFIMKIGDYIHCIPFIDNREEIFLKTIYKSRKLNKIYNSED